ncbi:MAG: hypothetical protein HY673_10790 [Chloroflexi bacterium]|nr:hypothetical protein [Chloroflexota bacterium]
MAIPADSYRFKGWGGDVSGSSDRTTVTMNSNKTLVVSFVKVHDLQTRANPSEGGRVEPAGGTLDAGTEVKLTAVANPGWRFNRWEGSVSGSVNPASVRMDGNKNVTATFTKVYSLDAAANPAEGGSVSEVKDGKLTPLAKVYDKDTRLTVVAIPAFPWALSRWSGTDNDLVKPTTVTMNSDRKIVAYFVKMNPGPSDVKTGQHYNGRARIPFSVKAGQWVEGGVSLTVGANPNEKFPVRVLDPSYGVLLDLGVTSNAPFKFLAEKTGDYYVDFPAAFYTTNYTVRYTIYS